ncbi:unnamed protein product [Caenorhabditis auriculariae]|uniref:Glycosyltransferase family 92 protein n=1 Tax=Caenorhabditis auriculariae TaxID=2777116 RepID=A0A8S1HT23_9PELO|nr:unnamed protein product [Caenorhabditis auriculariae]
MLTLLTKIHAPRLPSPRSNHRPTKRPNSSRDFFLEAFVELPRRNVIMRELHVKLRRIWSLTPRIRRFFSNHSVGIGDWIFRAALILLAIFCGCAWYSRTINMWSMKNIGDTFLRKQQNSRQIILGSFWREEREQNVDGRFAVIHFLGDSRIEHPVYCFSMVPNNEYAVTRATVQRIHRGKRAASDICSWAGHIAECPLEEHAYKDFKISTTPFVEDSMLIVPEAPLKEKRHDLVVCMAPMYIYTDWQTLLAGIEIWLAMGATKIVVPVQSASTTTYRILEEYQKKGIVIIRHWPKWPVLSDSNPNGLVLSRGIEESHVNCLFFTTFFCPWIRRKSDLELISRSFEAFSMSTPRPVLLLFEHRDVQFVPPKSQDKYSLSSFNFDFLRESRNKMNCNVWRMKTRVVVNASRVDSVNMHETGIHRFGYVQTRVPCRKAHFYHLRHSHNTVPSPSPIDMNPLVDILNGRWQQRLVEFSEFRDAQLNKSNTESLEDFDRCMGAINDEHWTMQVSRCLTPHVCFTRLKRNVDCIAVRADYEFYRSGRGYFMLPTNVTTQASLPNCEAPVPEFTSGNHFFAP